MSCIDYKCYISEMCVDDGELTAGLVAGVVVAVLAVCALLAGIGVLAYFYKIKRLYMYTGKHS